MVNKMSDNQWTSWFIAEFGKTLFSVPFGFPDLALAMKTEIYMHAVQLTWPDERLNQEVWYMLRHDVSFEQWNSGALPNLDEPA